MCGTTCVGAKRHYLLHLLVPLAHVPPLSTLSLLSDAQRLEETRCLMPSTRRNTPQRQRLAPRVHSPRIYHSLCPLCAYLRIPLLDSLLFATGRKTKESGGEERRIGVFAVSTSPSERPVRSSWLAFFLSSPHFPLFLPSSVSLFPSPVVIPPSPSSREVVSPCACSRDRFRLVPTSSYSPVDAPSQILHPDCTALCRWDPGDRRRFHS